MDRSDIWCELVLHEDGSGFLWSSLVGVADLHMPTVFSLKM